MQLSSTANGQAIDPITGTWQSTETNAYMTVAVVNDLLTSLFVIDDDGEVWPVSSASWNPATKTLRFTVKVPSTGYTLASTLAMSSPNTVHGSHTGTTSGAEAWSRVAGSPTAAAVPATPSLPPPPFYKKPLFWGIILGVVAASSAILALTLHMPTPRHALPNRA